MKTYRVAGLALVLGLCLAAAGRPLWAGEADLRSEVAELRKLLLQQAEVLKAQQKRIGELEKKIEGVSAAEVKTIRDDLARLAAEPGREVGPNDLRAFWKEGLRLENADKTFSLKIGGRIMADWSWMQEESDIRAAFGDLEDGFEFRRLRLYGAGRMYGNTDYKVQFDFAGNGVAIKDAFVGFPDLVPVGYLKVGHFKEPFSLEELTSSKYISFMERSLPVGAFSPSRNAGAQLSNHHMDDRLTWAAGVFRDVDSHVRSRSEGGLNLTARVTGLPWYEDEGAKLIHVGLAASYRDPKADGLSSKFESRPALHLAPKLVSTGAIPTDDFTLVGAEAALVCGPFSLQGEYIVANVDEKSSSGDGDFHGGYVEASYFLTGEHRKYKKSGGVFSRVKPKHNYGDGGLGAWQVAVRYDAVELDDGSHLGGELNDLIFGVNWHLNPNTRVMFNYANAYLDDVGRANLFGVRFQVDF